MSLNPVLKRLIKQAYINGFGELHTFSEEKIRCYLTHPSLNISQFCYEDYLTDRNITLRCYSPNNSSEPSPVVIFISATAFVLDRLGASNEYCTLMANQLGMRVINIQHRLAPEFKFPTFLEDCTHSVLWIANNATKLHIDPNNIGLWGESSGGSFAASATHMLRDMNKQVIKHLTLFYPLVDLVSSFPSKEIYANGYMLDRSFMQWLDERAFYPWQDRSTPLASPLLHDNFTGLPSLTMITAYYDPLRDEGMCYADKCAKAGIPVCHKQYPDMIHGFMRFYGKIKTAQQAFDFACLQVKQNLSAMPVR